MRFALLFTIIVSTTPIAQATQKIFLGGSSAERIFNAITSPPNSYAHLKQLTCDNKDRSQRRIRCLVPTGQQVVIPWKIRVERDFAQRIRAINCAYGFRRFDEILEKDYTCEVTLE